MELEQYKEKTVLITGGTKGFGKAIAINYAKLGAQVFITHKWGSVDEKELHAEFKQHNATIPHIIQSDVGSAEDIKQLMESINKHTHTLDVLISNVAFSKTISSIEDLKLKSLDLSIMYSAWPMVALIQNAKAILNHYPKYVIAISSNGPDVCHLGYDMAGTSKAVLETLVKYLALRLREHGVRINAIRPGFMVTESSAATFGKEALDILLQKFPNLFVNPDQAAKVCLALSSGFMDCVTGQIITVDDGSSLISPLSYITGIGLPDTPVEDK